MLEDIKQSIKSYWDEYPLVACTMIYGSFDRSRTVNDIIFETTIYMNAYNRVRGVISDEHWAIDYESLIRNLIKLCSTVVECVCKKEADWFKIIKASYETVKQSWKEIADENYCVYLRIKEIAKKTGNKVFVVEDVVAAIAGEKCNRQKYGFICKHMRCNENCSCDWERTRCSIEALEKQGLIKRVKINQDAYAYQLKTLKVTIYDLIKEILNEKQEINI